MFSIKNIHIVLICGVCLVVSGCAGNQPAMSKEEFSVAMSKSSMSVDTLLEKGDHEEATKILNDLAKRNPGRKEPWARLAKIHFDAKNYAQAIVAAEEVLQRDGADRSAKSIRAVAGLRVAAQSLKELRDDVELKGDARSDAVGLAQVMRDTLGEEVLVPPAASDAEKSESKKKAPVRRKRQVAPAAAGDAPGAVPVASGANPFSVLK